MQLGFVGLLFLFIDIFLMNTIRYTQNGILHMLDRNRRIKSQPEKFQDMNDRFDMIITCEERVYDQVVEGNLFTSYLDSLSTSYGNSIYVRSSSNNLHEVCRYDRAFSSKIWKPEKSRIRNQHM